MEELAEREEVANNLEDFSAIVGHLQADLGAGSTIGFAVPSHHSRETHSV